MGRHHAHTPYHGMMRLISIASIAIISYLTWASTVLSVSAWKPTSCGVANITTQWTNKVDPANVLPEYPRPQMVRTNNWKNLNGIWQFQAGTGSSEAPPFGKKLSGEILVPFPVESCLSGIGATQPSMYLWYRLIFDKPASFVLPTTTLHFGAVDWQTTVWLNGVIVGNNTGGYNGFHFDITPQLLTRTNELLIRVYDPSDKGAQPNGKQRISAITDPGGDTYTPSSGIWQTVWLENVQRIHIDHIRMTTDTRVLTLGVDIVGTTDPVTVTYTVHDGSKVITTGTVVSNTGKRDIVIPPPVKVWEPGSPFLYGLTLSLNAPGTDSVESYFGLRSFNLQRVHYAGRPDTGVEIGVDRPGDDLPGYPIVLPQADPNLCWALCNNTKECGAWAYGVPSATCETQPKCWLKNAYAGTVASDCRASGAKGIPPGPVMRPVLNGGFLFLAGWLDQSWWPDGQYTAPTDEALLSDLLAVQKFGFNVVRLHQKVNSQRWYWHADRLGIVVLQDMIQKYGGATAATVPLFYDDLQKMIYGRGNHPSIVQWTLFNEDDDWTVFEAHEALATIRSFDDTRLIDFDSGGGENPLWLGDVTDVHTYPYPTKITEPSDHQYAMIGEFGGIGAFIKGKEWVPGKCGTYLHVDTPQDEADTYVKMTQTILNQKHDFSVSIYTQITDVELECDGFLNYDRTNKFTDAQTKQIYDANQALIYGSF